MKLSSSVKISAVSLAIGGAIGACAAGANQRVQLIYEEYDCAVGFRHFLQDCL